MRLLIVECIGVCFAVSLLVRLPYTALADQKHGRRQCQRAWDGPQHAQEAKFLNLQFKDRGKIKLKVTFSGNIVELNLKKREFEFCRLKK